MKKKKIILIISIIVVLLLTIGVSLAAYTYTRVGSNQELVLGDIYMHYNEGNGITLENAMPYQIKDIVNPVMASQTYEEDTRNELSKCIDFVINYGYRTDDDPKSICQGTGTWYDLNFQDIIDGGYLNGYLSELQDNNIIVSDYSDISYFEFTISGKNTYTQKDIWYDISLIYGDNHETRNTRIRDDLLRFSLVKIKDGVEIKVVDNQNYSSLDNERIYVNTIEKNTTSEVNITYRLYMWIDYNTVIGNVNQDYTMEEWEDVFASIKVKVTGDFEEKEVLTDESCFATSISHYYIVNDIMKSQTYTSGGTNELSQCVDYFSDAYYFDEVEDAESYCKGEGMYKDYTFQYIINDSFSSSELLELENKNIIVDKGEVIEITDYDSSCGSDVVIPKEINGKEVVEIGWSAFENKGLTSVVIPNSVIEINRYAFYNNQLTNVEFKENSNLLIISDNSFVQNSIMEIIIPNSVTYLNCGAFDYGVLVNKSDSLVCQYTSVS